MPFDPENLPWRYREDAYYGKGSFAVEFTVEPESPELDTAARRRALQQLLLALRDETGLKVSAFVDVWDGYLDEPEQVELTPEQRDRDGAADPEEDLSAQAEFMLYNKLGVTSLAKLRRFMDEHLLGDVRPRITLVDPQTGEKFKATNFTIRYLFHRFTAHVKPDDWDRLRELMAQDDRGYRELMGSGSHRGAGTMRRRTAGVAPTDVLQKIQAAAQAARIAKEAVWGIMRKGDPEMDPEIIDYCFDDVAAASKQLQAAVQTLQEAYDHDLYLHNLLGKEPTQ